MTLVAKAYDRHVDLALRTTLDENLAMVRDTVEHLVAEGQRVFLDAEHFFDGYRSDPAYALEVVRTAAAAGADVVALCDTNGGMLPAGAGRRRRRGARRAPPPGSGSTATTTPPARWPTRSPRSTPVSRTCRARPTATASGPATPNLFSVVANLQLKKGRHGRAGRCARRADPDRARGLRGHQRVAEPAPAVRGAVGVRAQGRAARQRGQGRPDAVPAHRPRRRSATTCGCWSRTWPGARASSSRAASWATTSATTGRRCPGSSTG